MSDVSKIELDGEMLNIKDAMARETIKKAVEVEYVSASETIKVTKIKE